MGDNDSVQDPVEECHRWPQYQNTVSHAGRLPTPNIPYLAGIFDGETAAERVSHCGRLPWGDHFSISILIVYEPDPTIHWPCFVK